MIKSSAHKVNAESRISSIWIHFFVVFSVQSERRKSNIISLSQLL